MVIRIDNLSLANKRVLIRVDFNVPIMDGHITSDVRLLQAFETIRYAMAQGAQVTLMSHLGRPKEGQFDKAFSLELVAKKLSELLKCEVHLIQNPFQSYEMPKNEIALLENVRFLEGEKANDEQLSKQLASLCDVFVLDAFSVCHRAQASTTGVMRFAKEVCVGFSLAQELEAFTKALESPQRPLVAIVGGSKVSTKFIVLEKLLDKVDTLVLGGGMANTFLKAQGHPIGDSLFEADWCSQASELIEKADALKKNLVIPIDVTVARDVSHEAISRVTSLDDVHSDEKILDIGPKTISKINSFIKEAKTIVWNGPLGVFEFEPFSVGTSAIAQSVAQSQAFSVVGGGDTMAALEKAQVTEKISYCSTAGGAFLEFLEGRALPCLEALKERAQQRVQQDATSQV